MPRTKPESVGPLVTVHSVHSTVPWTSIGTSPSNVDFSFVLTIRKFGAFWLHFRGKDTTLLTTLLGCRSRTASGELRAVHLAGGVETLLRVRLWTAPDALRDLLGATTKTWAEPHPHTPFPGPTGSLSGQNFRLNESKVFG